MLSCSVSFPGTTINPALYQRLRYNRRMVHETLVLMAVLSAQAATGFTLQGQITTDVRDPVIRLILEDPKSRKAEVAETQADKDGHYEFRVRGGRAYRLLATIDGKKQD